MSELGVFDRIPLLTTDAGQPGLTIQQLIDIINSVAPPGAGIATVALNGAILPNNPSTLNFAGAAVDVADEGATTTVTVSFPPSGVDTVSAAPGSLVTVDNTDPQNPVVSIGAVLQALSAAPGSLISIDSSDPANPVLSLAAVVEALSAAPGSLINVDNADPANPVLSLAAVVEALSAAPGSLINVDNTDAANPVLSIETVLQTLSTAPGSLISVDNTDAANPVLSLATVVEALSAGTNISIDNTDAANPVISATFPAGGVAGITAPPGNQISVDNTDPANPVISIAQVVETLTSLPASLISVDATDPANIVLSLGQVVEAIGAGAGIMVDSTDPANPVISAPLSGVAGVSAPPGNQISVDNADPANPVISIAQVIEALSVDAGSILTIDNTDPANPIISNDQVVVGVTAPAGNPISVDNTDPANPVISAAMPLVVTSTAQVTQTATPTLPGDIINPASVFPVQFLTLDTTANPLDAGNYLLEWWFQWNADTVAEDFLARIDAGGLGLAGFFRSEPTDSISGGTPDTPPGSGSNQRYFASGAQPYTGISGAQTFTLEFGSSLAGDETTMIQATIKLTRVF